MALFWYESIRGINLQRGKSDILSLVQLKWQSEISYVCKNVSGMKTCSCQFDIIYVGIVL